VKPCVVSLRERNSPHQSCASLPLFSRPNHRIAEPSRLSSGHWSSRLDRTLVGRLVTLPAVILWSSYPKLCSTSYPSPESIVPEDNLNAVQIPQESLPQETSTSPLSQIRAQAVLRRLLKLPLRISSPDTPLCLRQACTHGVYTAYGDSATIRIRSISAQKP
jgi:hypothetical protein